ncbi:hypothetical protein ACS0TY_025160 [Phlomoides rotata]
MLLPLLDEATRGIPPQGPSHFSTPQPDGVSSDERQLLQAVPSRVTVSANPSLQTTPTVIVPPINHASTSLADPTTLGKVAILSFDEPHLEAPMSMQGSPSHAAHVENNLGTGPQILPSISVPPVVGRLSYVKAVANHHSEDISPDSLQAMKPVCKGMYLSVAIDEDLYKAGVSDLRDTLIGRIVHVRGDKPLAHDALVKRLGKVWGIMTSWSITPLGEGYYNIRFSCDADKERIFARRSWHLKLGLLRLQRWVPDFNPFRVNTLVVQAWIRISELPLEYWNKHIITALASVVGTVIKIDERTLNRTMGHFTRVLVELDLNQDREDTLMFERWGTNLSLVFNMNDCLNFANFAA